MLIQIKKGCLLIPILVLSVGLVACYRSTQEIPPSNPSRFVEASEIEYHEMWRVSSLLVGSSKSQIAYLRLTPNQIVAQNTYFGNRNSKLVAISVATGQSNWQIDYGQKISAMAVDDNNLYIAKDGDPLQAYDLQTGDLAWQSVVLPERRSYFLDVLSNTLVNYSSGFVQTINSATGELTGEGHWEVPAYSVPIKWTGEYELHQTAQELFAVDVHTGRLVWKTSTDEDSGHPLRSPPLSEDRVVMTYGWVGYDVYVFNYVTGNRLWKADEFYVSNAAVASGKVYVLRKDASLVVLDEITGIKLGHIKFSGPETDPNGGNYWVGANENEQVFIYFSDTQELVALQLNF